MIKIAIAGKNNIAINATKFLLQHYFSKNEILLIPNASDNGADYFNRSFLKFGRENNLNIADLNACYEIENLLFISLEFDKIIKPKHFKTKRLFNIHFSALPKYKGVFTSIMPILNGELKSAVTLHKIDSGIDTGDIIDQIYFNIGRNTTARELYFKYLKFGFACFKKNISNLIKQDFIFKPQNALESSYYSRKNIDFSNIIIDFKKSSFQIHNRLRAFIFKEYQLPIINKSPIIKSILSDEKIASNYFFESDYGFIISGIDGYKIYAIKDCALSIECAISALNKCAIGGGRAH